MVADGEWRDYAIDFLKDRAVFSIFRRASEVPIYRIEKNPKLARRQGAYSVISATGLIMRRGHELDRVLRVFDKKLSLVVTACAARPAHISKKLFVDAASPATRLGVVAPSPSARCISTLSSQRPCLKPILLRACRRAESRAPGAIRSTAICAESPITATI